MTIALLGLLLTLSFPAMHNLHSTRAMRTQVNDLVHAIHLARHTALISGNTITLCPSHDGNRCDYDAGWNDGWLLFTDAGSALRPQVNSAGDVLLSHRTSTPLHISANRPVFRLRSYGRRSTNGTFMFCDPRGRVDARRLVISYTGKPRAEPAPPDRCVTT
ncbi:MAG: type II transport protein [Gammaproteobacteria bacterium]|nr:type II transport protein [Gammaproteobacteria bacterium]